MSTRLSYGTIRLPVIKGTIDRRILVNFRIDPTVMTDVLPRPFRPKLVGRYAIGGICLIRLKRIRPNFLPIPWGIGSENAAHRIAVEWDENGETKQGVFIPRRDTNSRLNSLAGGTIFPGIHHHARFDVEESENSYSVAMRSSDGTAEMHVVARTVSDLSEASIFNSLQEASEFFEQGSLGYSVTARSDLFEGLELRCDNWHVEPLEIDSFHSSYFSDTASFPDGSVEIDCALLMRNIDHQWHGQPSLRNDVDRAN